MACFFSLLQGDLPEGLSARRLVVAADLAPALAEKFGVQLSTLCTLSGAQLEGCSYRHPLFERQSPVVVGGDYITTESGTGLVHTAPGHGQEDYLVGVMSRVSRVWGSAGVPEVCARGPQGRHLPVCLGRPVAAIWLRACCSKPWHSAGDHTPGPSAGTSRRGFL